MIYLKDKKIETTFLLASININSKAVLPRTYASLTNYRETTSSGICLDIQSFINYRNEFAHDFDSNNVRDIFRREALLFSNAWFWKCFFFYKKKQRVGLNASGKYALSSKSVSLVEKKSKFKKL